MEGNSLRFCAVLFSIMMATWANAVTWPALEAAVPSLTVSSVRVRADTAPDGHFVVDDKRKIIVLVGPASCRGGGCIARVPLRLYSATSGRLVREIALPPHEQPLTMSVDKVAGYLVVCSMGDTVVTGAGDLRGNLVGDIFDEVSGSQLSRLILARDVDMGPSLPVTSAVDDTLHKAVVMTADGIVFIFSTLPTASTGIDTLRVEGAWASVVDSGTHRLVIAGGTGGPHGSLSIVDLVSGSLIRTLAPPGPVEALALDQRSHMVAVVGLFDGIGLLDDGSVRLSYSGTRGAGYGGEVAVDSDQDRAYVTDRFLTGGVHVLDMRNGHVIANLIHVRGVANLEAVDPKVHRVYVASLNGQYLTVLDGRSLHGLAVVSLNRGTRGADIEALVASARMHGVYLVGGGYLTILNTG